MSTRRSPGRAGSNPYEGVRNDIDDSHRTPPTTQARLLQNIASVAGREDYVPVRLVRENGELCAEPVLGKSNLIFTLIRSQGIVRVPLDSGGLYEGETVSVRLF